MKLDIHCCYFKFLNPILKTWLNKEAGGSPWVKGAGGGSEVDFHFFVVSDFFIFYFEGFTSIPTALTANDRIQVYQASGG